MGHRLHDSACEIVPMDSAKLMTGLDHAVRASGAKIVECGTVWPIDPRDAKDYDGFLIGKVLPGILRQQPPYSALLSRCGEGVFIHPSAVAIAVYDGAGQVADPP